MTRAEKSEARPTHGARAALAAVLVLAGVAIAVLAAWPVTAPVASTSANPAEAALAEPPSPAASGTTATIAPAAGIATSSAAGGATRDPDGGTGADPTKPGLIAEERLEEQSRRNALALIDTQVERLEALALASERDGRTEQARLMRVRVAHLRERRTRLLDGTLR